MNNVWHFNRHKKDGSEGGHATPKPIDLCCRAILSSCPKDGLTLDFFLGSGSTLIACEKANRICYGCELSEHYCGVVINRYINFKNSNEDVFLLRDGEKIPYSKIVNNEPR